MSHVRQQIRAAAVTALTGLATTGDRVFPARARPLEAAHLPTLLVYVTEEESDYDAMAGGAADGAALARSLTLHVEGRAVASDAEDIENVLDGIAEEVEPALLAEPPLGGLVREIALIGTRIAVQAPGASYAGEIRLSFRVVYRTRERAPGAAI